MGVIGIVCGELWDEWCVVEEAEALAVGQLEMAVRIRVNHRSRRIGILRWRVGVRVGHCDVRVLGC